MMPASTANSIGSTRLRRQRRRKQNLDRDNDLKREARRQHRKGTARRRHTTSTATTPHRPLCRRRRRRPHHHQHRLHQHRREFRQLRQILQQLRQQGAPLPRRTRARQFNDRKVRKGEQVISITPLLTRTGSIEKKRLKKQSDRTRLIRRTLCMARARRRMILLTTPRR